MVNETLLLKRKPTNQNNHVFIYEYSTVYDVNKYS